MQRCRLLLGNALACAKLERSRVELASRKDTRQHQVLGSGSKLPNGGWATIAQRMGGARTALAYKLRWQHMDAQARADVAEAKRMVAHDMQMQQ